MAEPEMGEVITIDKALEIVRESVFPLGTEIIGSQDSLQRILAEPVYSDIYLPPFNRSTMDGYACRKADLRLPLTVIEEIPAGKSPVNSIGEGQCAKIMTGAEVPQGADVVIIKEESEILNDARIRFTGDKTHTNISRMGEDVHPGDKLLDAGILIRPEHLAILSTAGKTRISVYRKPSVAVLTTGSEIIEPERFPVRGKVRNSNGPQVTGQLRAIGITADDVGIVSDVKETIKQTIFFSLQSHDVIIISGGISVGDFDFVPEILKELNFEFLFSKLSSKPGKHTILAKKENQYIFGVPGNPVSAFVQFEILGKPLIYKLMGAEFKPFRLPVKLSEDFNRKNTERSEIIPVKFNGQAEIELIPYHGSAHIHALASADALMEIPAGIKTIRKGETVNVRPL